jgi:hypothetical protein
MFLIVLSLTIRARTHGAGSMVWNESISDLPWYDGLELRFSFSDSPFFAGLVIGSEKTGSSIDRLIRCLDILKCTLQAHFLGEDRRPESLSRRHLLENQVRKLESNPGAAFHMFCLVFLRPTEDGNYIPTPGSAYHP